MYHLVVEVRVPPNLYCIANKNACLARIKTAIVKRDIVILYLGPTRFNPIYSHPQNNIYFLESDP